MNQKIIAFTIAGSILFNLFHPFNGIVTAKVVEPPSSSYIPKRVGECIKPGGGSGNARPTPYCAPGYNPNDTFPYIVPCKDTTDRNTCHIADGTAIGEGFEWHIVDSRNYKSGGYVIQTSNQKSLLYEVRGNAIYFIQDTTWSSSTTCSNGKPAFQRINGKQGMLWAPRSLSCSPNFSYASEGTNAGFEYNENEEENLRLLPDNVTPCQAPHTGNVSGTKQLVFNGKAKCGSFHGDILVLRNESGAGAGEVFIYCKGVGLCGWYQNIDFSDPNNDPKTWVEKDICAGMKKPQETCYVECPAEGINKPVDFPLTSRLSGEQQTGVNLLNLEPGENEHTIAIQNQKHLRRVARAMLPGFFKIHEKGQQKPIINDPKEKVITLNQNNTEITVRSSLLVKGDKVNIGIVDVNEKGEDIVSINVSGSHQAALSEDTLWNDTDCKECREQDDYNKLLGSLSSKNKTDQNTTEGINLTKPVNRLADRIPVPNSASQAIQTKNKKAKPENKNAFSENGNTNIFLSIVNFIQQVLGKLFSIPAEVTSCTKISNDKDLYDNTKTATYAFLPQAKINILEQLPKSGESENSFNIKQTPNSNGENIKINQAFYPTNFVNTAHEFQICSVLPRNTKAYRERCGGDEESNSTNPLPPEEPFPEIPNSNVLSYEIPFKNVSCVVNQDTITRAIDLMKRYYPSYQEIGTRNLANLWQEIQNRSISQGINPTFALTLYIEESAACGAQRSYGMGCIYERHTARQMPACEANNPETSLSQVGCLASYVNSAPNFTGFMCRYSGEERDSNDQCSTFRNNPNFPNGVRFWYEFLSKGQPQECQMQKR